MRREAAAVGENADKTSAGGGINDASWGGAGAVGETAAGGVAPDGDAAIASEGRKGVAAGGDALISGAGRFTRAAVVAIAPGKDRAIVLQRGKGLFSGGDRRVTGAGRCIRLISAIGGISPDLDRTVGLQRRKCGQISKLLARAAQRVAGAAGRVTDGRAWALARQQVGGSDVDL